MSRAQHDFLEGLRVFIDLHRNEGMTDQEILEALRQKVRQMNEAQQDAA